MIVPTPRRANGTIDKLPPDIRDVVDELLAAGFPYRLVPATASDFAGSCLLTNISIDGGGTVQCGQSSGAAYSALMVPAVGSVSVLEYTAVGSSNMWFCAGKAADGGWLGFGDASQNAMGNAATFDGVSGSVQILEDHLGVGVNTGFWAIPGSRIRVMRSEGSFTVSQLEGETWAVRFSADLSADARMTPFADGSVGILQGAAYHKAQNALVYRG